MNKLKNAFDDEELEKVELEQQDILRLLLDADYYRVQIATLSPFDKIVGGLTWCTTWIGMQVKVHRNEVLVFREDANIGYKIALAEKLTENINQLGFTLEPHQIQGLDYPHLLPIFSALTKRVKEIRLSHKNVHAEYVGYLYRKMMGISEEYFDIYTSKPTTTTAAAAENTASHEYSLHEYDTNNLSKELEILSISLTDAQDVLRKRQEEKQALEKQIQAATATEIPRNQELRKEVERLINERTILEDKAVEYRLECKRNLRNLKQQIEIYEKKYQKDDNDDDSTAETETRKVEDVERLLSRIEILDIHIRNLKCKLDEIPENLELQQCQKRFIELYHLMSAELVKLRQKYSEYNTRENIRMQMSKEITLIKSIYENIMKAKTKQGQDLLLISISEWNDTVSDHLIKTEAKLQEAHDTVHKLQDRLDKLKSVKKSLTKLMQEMDKIISSQQH